MASMATDTLTLARELKAAEVPSGQAEAITAAIGRSASESMTASATKNDLALLRSEMKTDIADLKSTMITWFVGTILTVGAVVVAAIKVLL